MINSEARGNLFYWAIGRLLNFDNRNTSNSRKDENINNENGVLKVCNLVNRILYPVISDFYFVIRIHFDSRRPYGCIH